MASRRQRRVAELLHHEISQLLQYRIKDPRLGFVTVTGVEVSADLAEAWVYVVVSDETEVKRTLKGLASAASYLRRELGQNLILRQVPRLMFKRDTSLERGQRIENLLNEIGESEKVREEELGISD